MFEFVAQIANIAVLTIVVSVTVGARLQLSPALLSFTGPVYAEVQQRVLRGLKRFMPFVLLAALVTTILNTVAIANEGGSPFAFTLAAAVCFFAFLYVTFRYELPINKEVEDWSAETPPGDWAVKRTRWERWQTVRAWLSGAALGCVIAAALATTIDRAHDAEREAVAERLGAEALIEDTLDRSLLLALEGVTLDDSVETRSNLLAALLRSPAAIRVAQAGGGRVQAIALSPDGRTLATDDHEGNVVLLDAATLNRIGEPIQAPGQALSLAFSPDGRTLAVGGGARVQGSGYLVFVDVADAKVTLEVLVEGRNVRRLAYSPRGEMLATVEEDLGDGGPLGPSLVVLRDTATGQPTGGEIRSQSRIGDVAITPDGRSLVISGIDGRSGLWDLATLERLQDWDATGVVAVAPAGRTAAIGGPDGSVTLVDLESGAVRQTASRHGAAIGQVRFAPDGRVLITASDDFTATVWNVATATPWETLRGHGGAVSGVAVSLDGKTAYTGSLDGTVIAWDMAGDRRLGRPLTFSTEPLEAAGLAVSPDGALAAVTQPGGQIRLLDAASLEPVGEPLAVADGLVQQLAFSSDGRTLAVTATDGTVAVVDIASRSVRPIATGLPQGLTVVALTASGRTLAVGGESGQIELWDAQTATRIGTPLELGAMVDQISFDSGGQRLAAALVDGRVEVWDVAKRERLLSFTSDRAAATSVSFSPDGRLLVAAGLSGSFRLFEASTGEPLGGPIQAHAGVVLATAFGPDGRWFLTSGADGTVSLWDVASHRRIGSPLPIDANQWIVADFTAGGRRILAIAPTGRGVLWDVDPASWRLRVCAAAGRPLSRDEWEEFLPDRAYEPACAP
jgi:WD40 repeat protein